MSDWGREELLVAARAAVAVDAAERMLAEKIDSDNSLIVGLELAGALLREFQEQELTEEDDAAIEARLSAEVAALQALGPVA